MVKQQTTLQRVFVLSADGQTLDPCHPAQARHLLRERRAAIARRYPFTIILKECMAVESVVYAHAIKIGPGSCWRNGDTNAFIAAETMCRSRSGISFPGAAAGR